MLSKLLTDAGIGSESIVWRRSGALGSSAASAPCAPKPDAQAKASGEIAQLRSKVAELEAAAEGRLRQAYESGMQAGEEAARQSLEAGVRETVEQLAGAIADVASTRADTIRRAEADTVRLAIEIARRVLHREVSVDPSALEGLIKAALEKLQNQEVHRVRVHPDQERLVRACLDQAGRGQAAEVVVDPVQPRGGVVFEISRGALDASLDTQLAEIERGLVDQLEARV
jgi:flagellar assembly protein FliH